MATISGGGGRDWEDLPPNGGGGICTSRSGLEKREARRVACWAEGVEAKRFLGGCERGTWDCGTDSGIGSDIFLAERER